MKKGKSITKPFDKRRFETVRCVLLRGAGPHSRATVIRQLGQAGQQKKTVWLDHKKVVSLGVDNGSRGKK